MDDRGAQFLIAVGDLCTAAGLAGLDVEVRVRGRRGEPVRGVPYPHPGPEIHDTGYPAMLVVHKRIIDLETVEACTVYAPSARLEG